MNRMVRQMVAVASVLLVLEFVPIASAQVASGRRPELQDHLANRYRLTLIGPGLLGLTGSRSGIRRAGGMVVLRQAGLSGSLDRDQPASFSIHEAKIEPYRGSRDAELAPGERFYVHSVYVGSDVVTVGLVTVRTVLTPKGSGPLWTGLSFFFPPEMLERGEVDRVSRALDAWILPEDSFRGASAPAVEPEPPPAASAPSALKAGMSRAEVVAALGSPRREVSFGDRTWLTYPGLVVLLEKDKLVSADASGQPPAKVTVASEPDAADVYLEGSFVGSTPTTLELQPGSYKVSVRLAGYTEWQRELKVLAGSEINLRARLEK